MELIAPISLAQGRLDIPFQKIQGDRPSGKAQTQAQYRDKKDESRKADYSK
jgi:hypothetical protein